MISIQKFVILLVGQNTYNRRIFLLQNWELNPFTCLLNDRHKLKAATLIQILLITGVTIKLVNLEAFVNHKQP